MENLWKSDVVIMSKEKEVIWGNAQRKQEQGNANERHKMTDLDQTSGDNTNNWQKQAAQPVFNENICRVTYIYTYNPSQKRYLQRWKWL